jgi:tRNA(His) guanylyltransferase
MLNTEAENLLKGTLAADKNEILFSRFKINYNNEPEMFRKGSVVFREYELDEPQDPVQEMDDSSSADAQPNALSKTQTEKIRKERAKARIVVKHLDIINDEFWERRSWILSGKVGRPATRSTS